MAFCSNCGKELTDGAQFCPNCGQQVNQRPSTSEEPKGFVESFKETWKELESEEKNKSNLQSKPKNEDDGKLSKTKKFFLGWAFLVALFGVLVGFSTEEEGGVMIAISALALILIICTFVGKINSKYAWYVSLGSMLFITLLVGSGNDNKKKDTAQPASVEQKQEVTDEQQTEKEKEKTEVKEEQVPQKSKEEEIRELGYRDGVIWGKEDKGQYLVEYIQMGLPMSSALERVKQVARMGYKENYGSDISDELLEEFAEQFMEGYKSVVVKE